MFAHMWCGDSEGEEKGEDWGRGEGGQQRCLTGDVAAASEMGLIYIALLALRLCGCSKINK